jgi:hypothetical protein
MDKSKGFSAASVQGWGFIGPHGVSDTEHDAHEDTHTHAPHDVTRMVAALLKYGLVLLFIASAFCSRGMMEENAYC